MLSSISLMTLVGTVWLLDDRDDNKSTRVVSQRGRGASGLSSFSDLSRSELTVRATT